MRTFKTPKGTELPIGDMKGKDYLFVQWRLVWFREEKPNWTIQTELLKIDENSALAKAEIVDEMGRTIATAHKYQSKQGFHSYVEKAETGAVGRALAYCGFGTQFCGDELEEGEDIADAPIEPRQTQPKPRGATPEQNSEGGLSEAQIGLFKKMARERKLSMPQVKALLKGYQIETLPWQQFNSVLDELKKIPKPVSEPDFVTE